MAGPLALECGLSRERLDTYGFSGARAGTRACSLQHSPSSGVEAKASGKMFDLRGWECLCKCVGDHVGSGTVGETDAAIIDKPANEMKAYVDVL